MPNISRLEFNLQFTEYNIFIFKNHTPNRLKFNIWIAKHDPIELIIIQFVRKLNDILKEYYANNKNT